MADTTIEIGTMQGRLLPPVGATIQAFPADGWRDEFPRAQQAGLDCIEWIYEMSNADRNPLGTREGIVEIRRLGERHGVGVRSICADYFMDAKLIDGQGRQSSAARERLRWLIGQAAELGAAYIVLPFINRSALNTTVEWDALVALLRDAAGWAEGPGVEMHVEAAMAPRLMATLVARAGHPLVRVNYDSGNSALFGFSARDEMPILAPWIGSFHVKDARVGETTVALGTGDTDFDVCFEWLRKIEFNRWLILQAARGVAGQEVEQLRIYRAFVERHVVAARRGRGAA